MTVGRFCLHKCGSGHNVVVNTAIPAGSRHQETESDFQIRFSDPGFRVPTAHIRFFPSGIFAATTLSGAVVEARKMDDVEEQYMDDDELLEIALLLALDEEKPIRRYWVHPLNTNRISESPFYLKRAKLRANPEAFLRRTTDAASEHTTYVRSAQREHNSEWKFRVCAPTRTKCMGALHSG